MTSRNDSCLKDLSGNIEDVLANAEKVKGKNFRMFVTYLANTATATKMIAYAASDPSDADRLKVFALFAATQAANAAAYADALKLSEADRTEAMRTADVIGGIVKATNEGYDNGNKADRQA